VDEGLFGNLVARLELSARLLTTPLATLAISGGRWLSVLRCACTSWSTWR